MQAGLAARTVAEEESQRAVSRWEAALRAGEVDDRVRKEELKAVEKMEVLLKVSKRQARLGRFGSGRGRRQTALKNLGIKNSCSSPPPPLDYWYLLVSHGYIASTSMYLATMRIWPCFFVAHRQESSRMIEQRGFAFGFARPAPPRRRKLE